MRLSSDPMALSRREKKDAAIRTLHDLAFLLNPDPPNCVVAVVEWDMRGMEARMSGYI